MITRRGWALAAGSFVLATTGRILGVLELFVLATGGLALVVSAVAMVAGRRGGLEARRRLHPPRVPAGSDSRVELVIRNRRRRRLPVLTVRDAFDGGRRHAQLLLPPIDGEREERASYRLPTERRGLYEIGPLEALRSDPFGLASSRWEVAPTTELVVYPRIDPVVPLPRTMGQDPNSGADHATAVGPAGEDFYGLRGYQMGDDLRRVHWPSTARSGELMIRQHEMPWQGRVTVLLDARSSIHDDDSLESAVSAAASVAVACWQHGWLVRLVTTEGFDSGFAAVHDQLEALLYHLAILEAGDGDHLEGVVGGLQKGSATGALTVVTTTAVGGADLERLARLRARFGSLIAVVFDRAGGRRGTSGRHTGAGSDDIGGWRRFRRMTLVKSGGAQEFAEAWNSVIAGHRPSHLGPRRRRLQRHRGRR